MSKIWLSPTKNASSLGFLFILIGAITLLSDLTSGMANILVLLPSIIRIIVGFGLRKHKMWAVYTIGVSALLSLVSILTSNQGNSLMMVGLLFFAIDLAIFLWFYSARKDFT